MGGGWEQARKGGDGNGVVVSVEEGVTDTLVNTYILTQNSSEPSRS